MEWRDQIDTARCFVFFLPFNIFLNEFQFCLIFRGSAQACSFDLVVWSPQFQPVWKIRSAAFYHRTAGLNITTACLFSFDCWTVDFSPLPLSWCDCYRTERQRCSLVNNRRTITWGNERMWTAFYRGSLTILVLQLDHWCLRKPERWCFKQVMKSVRNGSAFMTGGPFILLKNAEYPKVNWSFNTIGLGEILVVLFTPHFVMQSRGILMHF